MQLDLKALLEVFDGTNHPGAGLVASAEGEHILRALLLHALDSETASTTWRSTQSHLRVQPLGGKGGVLDDVLHPESITWPVQRIIVEYKFWTANSIDHRRLAGLANLGRSTLASAGVREVATFAEGAWHEGQAKWKEAGATPLTYSDFITEWPDVAKTIWPLADDSDLPSDQRLLAVWRPITSTPMTRSPAVLPNAFSPLRVDISTASHLNQEARLFSGSLYARHLLEAQVTHIPVQPSSVNKIPDAYEVMNSVYVP